MALGDYLASLNLDPSVVAKLQAQAGEVRDLGEIDPPVTHLGEIESPGPDALPGDARSYALAQRLTSGSRAPTDPYTAPTPAEMASYGAAPAEAAAATRYNAPADMPAQGATNPVQADPKWDPEAEATRTLQEAGKRERAAATPQGPAGDDGFPTYRDLSSSSGSAGGLPTTPQRVVPAGWQPGTRGESRAYGYNPDELQDGAYHRDAASGQRLLAADAHLVAAQQQAEADAGYAAAHQEATRRAEAQAAKLAADRQAYVAGQQGKLEDLSTKAQAKVDVDLAQGPAGAQIFAAIGIALGQFGASLTGGPNTALQIVNANIDRRIAAQQANIANAGKTYDRENSLYKENLAEFGDKQRAILATKVQYLDQAKAIADQQYAISKKTANEGQYHALVAGIQDDRAKAADDFAKLTHTQVNTQGNEHYKPAHVVGGEAGAKGKEALYVPTMGGYARDAETARKLNGKGAMRMQINEDLRGIDKLLAESKGLDSVTGYGRMQEIRAEIESKKHEVLRRTTVLREQGAMSEGDKAVAEVAGQLKDVDPQLKTEAAIERMRKGIKSVATMHQRDQRLDAEANGIQLGTEQYRKDLTGNQVPVAKLAGANKVVTKKTETVDDMVEAPKGKSSR